MCFKIMKDRPIGTEFESANHIVYIKYQDKDLSITVAKALIEDMISSGMANDIKEACLEMVESKRSEICNLLKSEDPYIFINSRDAS